MRTINLTKLERSLGVFLILILLLTSTQVGLAAPRQAVSGQAANSLTAPATWVNGVAASLVLGQPDFTKNSPNNSRTNMDTPTSLAVDSSSGKIFVADSHNNHVKRFASLDKLSNGAAADAIFNVSADYQTPLNNPSGVALDGAGNLWVADSNNNRVVLFLAATTRSSDCYSADGVLGQANFSGNGYSDTVTAAGLKGPTGVAVDSAGNLWVADYNHNRVLVFQDPIAKATNMAAGADKNASGVLGQPDFTLATDWQTSQSGMWLPYSLAADAAGNLWVADTRNYRVLLYKDAFNKAIAAAGTDKNASGVLGQPGFTSNDGMITQTGMNYPSGVAVDTAGTLWVADTSSNRVLRFDDALSKADADGAPADGVLGQTDFTNWGNASDRDGMHLPFGVAVDGTGRLWVADYENNRVLLFQDGVNVQSITRDSAEITSAASVAFTVTFDGPVSGVAESHFSLTSGGEISGASISHVASLSPSAYRVTVDTGVGAGSLRLDLVNDTGLGPQLENEPYTLGEAYTLNQATRTAVWTDGALASLVLGQPNFTQSFGSLTLQDKFRYPSGVAVDPSSGAVFVSDPLNNRVLRFASLQSLSNGALAAGVLGQAGFTNSASAASQAGMNRPQGLAVDSAGQLWVADQNNHRVLLFKNAAAKANGAAADGMLGQASFVSRTAAAGKGGMNAPFGVAVDGAGRLWVADDLNHRVLRFDNAASKADADGAEADGVLGQPDFDSTGSGTAADQMYEPYGLATGADGTLWVADYENNRVLRFASAANKQAGDPADGVLGQVDLQSNAQAAGRSGMDSPYAVAVDGTGRLWVADTDNHRVLRFDDAASKADADGAPADGLLGIDDFNSQAIRLPNQFSVYTPYGLTVDGAGRLWVADFDRSRVMLFQNGVAAQITRASADPTHALNLTFTVAFDGPVTGLTAANFSLTTSGAVSGASITALVSITASIYAVMVNTGIYTGSLRLDLVNRTGLVPVVTNVPYSGGETYTIDQTTRYPAVWNNFAPASLVLGQPDFTSTEETATQSGMYSPYDVVVDPASGAIYVADCGNNRVLRYASLKALSNGSPANGVLGQPDFTSQADTVTQSGMYCPTGVAVDGAGTLWVVDDGNSRVLRFDHAALKANGADADGVLGQPDFTSADSGSGPAGMDVPLDVAVDGAGRVWVADYYNSRVLRFDHAALKANGADADGVLGQPDFDSNGSNAGKAGMSYPISLAVTSTGTLWVADASNRRVLRFDDAAGKANGGDADGVLGQPNFNITECGLSQIEICDPEGVAVDGDGTLWVAEYANNRVLRFDSAANKPDGAPADGVLGQPGFTSKSAQATQNGMGSAQSVATDSAGRLWVVDYGFNRLALYQKSVNVQITRASANPARDASVVFRVAFDGPVSGLTTDNFSLTTTGGISGASITALQRVNASAYTVTVASGTGTGTLSLDQLSRSGLVPMVLNAPYTTGETYTFNLAQRPTAAWSDGAPARLVLGQPGFSNSPSAFSQTSAFSPAAVAVDPTSGAVFVADGDNNRVLRYPSLEQLSSGAAASGVLGQPDFTSSGASATAAGMSFPAGLAFDSAGTLWVADQNNNRVMRFDAAAAKANGAPADGVLGQPGFASGASALSQAGLDGPSGVAVDGAGTLWVADQNNNRVLRFDDAAAKAIGAPADGALGQPDFTSSAAATTQAGLSHPAGVTIDGAGRLWVADQLNNRVLRFNAAAAKAIGAPADGVLGQPDFTQSATGFGASGTVMFGPIGVAVSYTGTLWVADYEYNRVLRFDNAASKSGNVTDGSVPANGVLGQADFTSRSATSSAAGVSQPSGIAVDSTGRLWVADTGNQRVLMFQVAGVFEPLFFSKTGPATGATGQDLSLTLSWAANPDAASYDYCYDTTNNDACDGSWTNTLSTSALISGLANNTIYYWQVRANNSGGSTGANVSAWWKFSTPFKSYLPLIAR